MCTESGRIKTGFLDGVSVITNLRKESIIINIFNYLLKMND